MNAAPPEPVLTITSAELDWAREARAAHPEMTSYGFLPNRYDKQSDGWEEGLTRVDLEQVVVSRRWLELCGPWRVRATRDCIGSYSAKHRAERWSSLRGWGPIYVKEGALLFAAVAIGVPLLRYPEPKWGAYLGLTRRGLQADKPDGTCSA